ncbi:MAG: DegT/DnrJ/EryC1/StrS family aminotransferase [Cytophagales bacterium]|nr:DegT/DnrJ/EryC1/StrS family aminotransferase [Cytophagales bacterium]
MKKIQMVDLTTQHSHIKEKVLKGIEELIDSSAFIKGKAVQEFEKELAEFLGVKHVISCGNGTDALQIALMALNLPENTEVLVPSFNYVATAEVIALLGLKPVFVEAKEDIFNIDIEDAKTKITANTKVIMPVHLFGQCADIDSVLDFAKENDLYVIEDTAQAIGSVYRKKGTAGTFGDIGTTSFFPSKNLGCMGDGGAMFTNNDELASKLRMIANHGQKQKYHFDCVGVNSRLDTLQATILRAKLPLLKEYSQKRLEGALYYNELLKNNDKLTTPLISENSTHVFHQYTLKLAEGINRDEIQAKLREREVPSMVYYPIPLHLQRAYEYLGYKEGDLPTSEKLAKQVLSLPIHPEITKEQIEFIVKNLEEVLG